jgi:hypothetical protein
MKLSFADPRFALVVLFSSLGLFCLTLAGCQQGAEGPPLAKSTGTVKYKGAPVSGASVTFLYEDGQTGSGVTDDAGRFNITTGGREGAPVGTAKVLVTKIASTGTADLPANPTPEDMIKMYQQAGGKKEAMPKTTNALPDKYAGPTKTDLTADVKADQENDFLFELRD